MLPNDLFAADLRDYYFGPDAMLLAGYALPYETALLDSLEDVLAAAPLRYWEVPGGYRMSAAKSNCGMFGWVSDRTGYRYTLYDPDSGKPWPPMPEIFLAVAQMASAKARFKDFIPDGCLINGYAPGAKLSLHQDKDERDLDAPVVAISLGLPAIFLFGGPKRKDPTKKVFVQHGDVVIWGRESRLYFHGIAPLKDGNHPLLGKTRISLTFRKT